MTDPRGNSGDYAAEDFTVGYEYDDLDRIIIGTLPKHGDISENPEVKYDYDLRGNLKKSDRRRRRNNRVCLR